jgi:hypothetical protein
MQIDTDSSDTTAAAPDSGGDDLRAELERAILAEPDPSGSPDASGATTQPDDGSSGPDTATAEPDGKGDAPPASWTKEAKQEWAYLSQTARAEIQRREKEVQTALSQTSDARKLSDTLSPYIDQMKAAGVQPAAYVESLLNWNAALRTQPSQALVALSQQFIGDAQSARAVVNALAQRFGLDEWDTGSEGTRVDPAASQQVVSLEARLRQQELATAQREWQEFQAAKAGDGKPLHPHADDLKAEMADAIRANPQLSFSEAYDRAKWINPGVRQRLLDAEAQQRAAAAKAQASKGRGMALPRGRGGDAGVPSRDDLRGELREQMARTGLRVSE